MANVLSRSVNEPLIMVSTVDVTAVLRLTQTESLSLETPEGIDGTEI